MLVLITVSECISVVNVLLYLYTFKMWCIHDMNICTQLNPLCFFTSSELPLFLEEPLYSSRLFTTFIVTFYCKYSSLFWNNHGTIYQKSNMENNVQIRHENNQQSNQEIGMQTKSKPMKEVSINITSGVQIPALGIHW